MGGTDTIKIYLVGSMRNPAIPELAKDLREMNYEVFDDWFSPGPEADERWNEYEKIRGRTFREALEGEHVKTVFEFDKRHIDDSDHVALILPAGKSGHLELGYAIGTGKVGHIVLDGEPDRYDIMYRFADHIHEDIPAFKEYLKEYSHNKVTVEIPNLDYYMPNPWTYRYTYDPYNGRFIPTYDWGTLSYSLSAADSSNGGK